MTQMKDEDKREFKMQGNGRYVLEFFPQPYVDLNNELNSGLHPKLVNILAPFGPDDIDMRLAHISAYLGIMLDADYTLKDRIRLCEILVKKLVEKREMPQGIILS